MEFLSAIKSFSATYLILQTICLVTAIIWFWVKK